MADAYMRKLRDLPQSADEFADLVPLLTEIHRRLPQKGKLKYGYMPKDVKNLVDEVVDRLAKHPKVAELYELWYQQKCAIIATYTKNFPPKEPLSENETFRPIKNVVLEAAKEMGNQRVPLTIQERLEGGEPITATTTTTDELEETLERLSREHSGEMEPIRSTDENGMSSPSFRSIESFLYRVSKVFQDKRPVGEHGQVMDHKAYVRQSERKHELGMK